MTTRAIYHEKAIAIKAHNAKANQTLYAESLQILHDAEKLVGAEISNITVPAESIIRQSKSASSKLPYAESKVRQHQISHFKHCGLYLTKICRAVSVLKYRTTHDTLTYDDSEANEALYALVEYEIQREYHNVQNGKYNKNLLHDIYSGLNIVYSWYDNE